MKVTEWRALWAEPRRSLTIAQNTGLLFLLAGNFTDKRYPLFAESMFNFAVSAFRHGDGPLEWFCLVVLQNARYCNVQGMAKQGM